MKQEWGGDILRTSAAALVFGGGLPAVRPPAQVASGALRGVSRDAVLLERAARDSARFQEAELCRSLDVLGWAGELLLRARLRLACEVAQRGLHQDSGFALIDWLALRSPDLSAVTVRELATAASASTDPVHAPVVDGILEGRMTLSRGVRLLRSLQRVRSALGSDLYGQAVDALADHGSDARVDDAALQRTVEEFVRRCLPESEPDEHNKARRHLRDVHESSLVDGSVKRLIWTFGDDADYEAVRAILESPLAAPASQEEQEATGVAETRTPGQRRYDALLTVLRRGVAGTQGQPTTPKAMLMVTLDFEVLRQMLSEKADRPGCGSTLDGATVTADSIRRLACEAEIIPVVLGSAGEVVDQGRRVRLVTPGQRVSLAQRDQGCTIPGCTVPATWCDAHHVVWWSRGGRSDLLNYALLCPRHHTWVHDHEHTATVDALGVTWHLR